MRTTLISFLGLIVATSASAQTPTPARGTVDGVVTNVDLVPLPQATISILGSAVHVATGDNGRFRISALPAGRYIFVVNRLGFVAYSTTMDVVAGDTLRPSFTLEPVTNVLDTVVVKAKSRIDRLSEFDARRRAGLGKFITRDQIESRNALKVSELLRPILGVEIMDRGGLGYAVSTRGCLFNIFVDGLREGNPNLMLLPTPDEIAGIEVYTTPAYAPVQYGSNTRGCGSIFIWTLKG